MKAYNGYCQLIEKEDGLFLKIIPPVEGGKPITYDEVLKYLRGISLSEFDLLAVMRACKNATPNVEIKIKEDKVGPIAESLVISMDSEELTAVGRFYPPSNNGDLLNEEKIINILKANKVVACINHQAIKNFLNDRHYNTDIILAKGNNAVQGSNGYVVYHFETNVSAQPKINEDGSVDYHQLDMIQHVKEGDLLASVVPAVQGKNGILVTGKTIAPGKVSTPKLKFGKNIRLSPDGMKMYSEVSGHVYLVDDKVFVSNLYDVLSNVDGSTGDIEYSGDVHIKGNVTTGFNVKAEGQIIVDGVVEGSRLEAGGPIIIKGGIQGMSKGVIISGSNITTKFIENATVISGGSVTSEAILHSKVSAKKIVEAQGKRGLIVGGEIKAGEAIIFKVAGSTMGTYTNLEVGIDPEIVNQYRALDADLRSSSQEITQLSQVASSYRLKIKKGIQLNEKQMLAVRQISARLKELEKDVQEKLVLREELGEQVLANNAGCITVNDKIYPGVKIVISNCSLIIKTLSHYCKFIKEGEEIVMKPQ